MARGSARGKGDCNFPLVPMPSDKIIVFQAGACTVSATSPLLPLGRAMRSVERERDGGGGGERGGGREGQESD